MELKNVIEIVYKVKILKIVLKVRYKLINIIKNI